ncbi:MAG: GTPase ObgE [Firmicutes bacterium]|nr:GTPase ObgE [Bacillota bacterium]
MFIDKVKIFIKPGNGGDGAVSFYTEKYVAKGGPDGGDGGKGGDIVFLADDRKTSLADFRFTQAFRAEDGARGSSTYCHGKGGKDLVIKVPRGTIIRDEETGGILADMFADGASLTAIRGGTGGKGNARFKSSRRQTPTFAQMGVKTEEKAIILELKTIADVGLVGFPNVGKSTLLSVISSARPKIANYHFTTLSPVLGIVQYYDHYFTVADIPGLIEGAADGAGLGHDFLRHIERTRLIVHVIDIGSADGRDPVKDYRAINAELKKYSEVLSCAPQIVVLNKCDLLSDEKPVLRFKKLTKTEPIKITGAIAEGTDALIAAIYEVLKDLPPLKPLEFEPFEYAERDTSEFDVVKIGEGEFEVFGGMIDELARNVTLNNPDSLRFFHKRLKEEGVLKSLRRHGVKNGDTVHMLDIEFEYTE